MASDLVVKIGGDVSEFQESLAGLAERALHAVGSINPVIAGTVGLIAGIGIAAVEVAHEYEDASNIIIAKTGATGESLQGLKDDWDAVFKADGAHNAEEIANAIGGVNVSLQLTGEPLQKATKGFLDLADNLKEQVEPLLKSTTQAMHAWGIVSSETTDIQDKLLVVHQKTGISVTELSAALAAGEPILKQFGLSFEESATLLGQFNKAGVDSGTAIASLQKSIKTLTEAGITPNKEAFLGMIDNIKNASTESASTTAAIELFGRSGAKMAEIIRDGKVDIDSLAGALGNSKGAVEAMDAKTDTFSEKLTQLWRNVSAVLEPFGTGLIEADKAALDMFNALFIPIDQTSGAFKDLLDFIKPFTDFFKTNLAPVLKDVAAFVVGLSLAIFEQLIPTFKAWWEITKTLATFARDVFVAVWTQVTETIGDFINIIKLIPGVSSLFEKGQLAINDALGGTEKAAKGAGEATGDLTAKEKAAKEATDASTQAHLNIAAAVENAKAAKVAVAEATKVLKEAENDLSAAYKATHIPVIQDLEKALADVATQRGNVNAAAVALKTAEDDLSSLLATKGTPNAKAVKDATADVETARKDLKTATDVLNQSEKALADTQKLVTTAANDIKASEAELSAAYRATHIPVVLDYQTALENVNKARDAVTLAAQDQTKAEDDLAAIIAQKGTKSAQDIKTAEDNLTATRKTLKEATDKLSTSESDLNKSQAAIYKADAELAKSAKTLTDAHKLLDTTTNSLRTSLTNYRTQLDNVRTAEDNLRTATANLQQKKSDTRTTTDELNKATNDQRIADDALKTAMQNLGVAQQDLTGNYHVGKTALDALKTATNDVAVANANAQASMNALGLKSREELQSVADKAADSYDTLKESGTRTQKELDDALIVMLQKRKDALAASGTDLTTADQNTLDLLLTQQDAFNTKHTNSWKTMYDGIKNAVQTFSSDIVHTLITGDGSFGDATLKMLQGIGEAVLNKFIQPATDAIATFIAGAITDLLSGKGLGGILDDIKNIGSGLAKAFGGGANVAGDVAGAGAEAGQAAGGAGGAAGAAGSLASAGVTGIISAVTGVISAVTGVISVFQNMHQETSLNAIEHNTRYTMMYVGERADGGILGEMFRLREEVSFGVSVIVAQQSRDMIEQSRNALNDISSHTAYIQPTLDYFGSYITVVPDKLDALIAKPTNVNVKVLLDSKQIAAVVTTEINDSLNLQVA